MDLALFTGTTTPAQAGGTPRSSTTFGDGFEDARSEHSSNRTGYLCVLVFTGHNSRTKLQPAHFLAPRG